MLARAAEGEAAWLRGYGWSPATLSLGYFQAAADASPRWDGSPIVRRATGGGAIGHDRELTYALALPRSDPLARRAGDLYRAVHAGIAAVLADRGIVATRRGGATAAGPRPFLCFADRDPDDLVVAGAKVVGGAQRRRSGAVLQHGSILLSASPLATELPGLAERTGVVVDPVELAGELIPALAAAIGRRSRPYAIGAADREAAGSLAERPYRDPAWTGRR